MLCGQARLSLFCQLPFLVFETSKVAGANATAAQVQSFVQDAIDMSVAHPDMTWSDFLKQRPGRAYETLVSSIFQSAVLAGLGRATLGQGNAGKQPGQGADRTEAENLTSNLRAAFDLARRSKLAGRDPGAFQHSVQQIADTHGIGTVHLASGKLMQALTTPGIDAAGVLRRMPATLAQLRDLPVQGGDLAIPTGELIAGISGSGAEAAILQHLRRVPDALSLDQLRQQVAGPNGSQPVATAGDSGSPTPPADANVPALDTPQPTASAAEGMAGDNSHRLYPSLNEPAGKADYYFRGTSEGFEGNAGNRTIGRTPVSSNPIIATLFATESEQHGNGVIHIALPEDLAEVTIDHGNVRQQVEREYGIHLTPTEFAQRASITITAKDARRILGEMGFHFPDRIYSENGQNIFMMEKASDMTDEQIKEFVARARASAVGRQE